MWSLQSLPPQHNHPNDDPVSASTSVAFLSQSLASQTYCLGPSLKILLWQYSLQSQSLCALLIIALVPKFSQPFAIHRPRYVANVLMTNLPLTIVAPPFFLFYRLA